MTSGIKFGIAHNSFFIGWNVSVLAVAPPLPVLVHLCLIVLHVGFVAYFWRKA